MGEQLHDGDVDAAAFGVVAVGKEEVTRFSKPGLGVVRVECVEFTTQEAGRRLEEGHDHLVFRVVVVVQPGPAQLAFGGDFRRGEPGVPVFGERLSDRTRDRCRRVGRNGLLFHAHE